MGIKKARVLPLPVTASTTTSLYPMNSGIVEACTGVILEKPMLDVASRIHCERPGVNPSHDRDELVLGAGLPLSGAMLHRHCAGFRSQSVLNIHDGPDKFLPKAVRQRICRHVGNFFQKPRFLDPALVLDGEDDIARTFTVNLNHREMFFSRPRRLYGRRASIPFPLQARQ